MKSGTDHILRGIGFAAVICGWAALGLAFPMLAEALLIFATVAFIGIMFSVILDT